MAAPNAHVKVAGSWKRISKLHVKASGAWKQVSNAYVRVGGVWKKVLSSLSFPIGDCSVTDYDDYLDIDADGSASAKITFSRNGTYSLWYLDGGTQNGGGDWISPKSGTVGDGYWVRFTPTSGTFSSGSTAWQQISADRSVTCSQLGQGTKSCTFTVEIAIDSGGSSVVASRGGNVLVAQVETGA